MFNAQEYLSQYQYIINSLISLQLQREELHTKLTRTVPTLTGMPHGNGGNSRKTENGAIKLSEIDAKIEKINKAFSERSIEIMMSIYALPDTLERNVIEMIYLNNLTESDVAERTGKSKETIRQLHKSGLSKIKPPEGW